ncbi:DEAD/DEAH box helicase [Ferrimonas senticii]|uniref:DEAD/DEAH box helicase n=1 Tax=Ferrimonas senticii TaxID=394566 RepID=UPI0003F90BCF|nr:DEAD/DEAH box helicase [Ferrimonas senticii]
MSFNDLGLSAPLLRAIEEQGYTTPTPIQAEAIPAVLAGQDVMAAAQTGTGKTAGFTLPILERLQGSQRASANRCKALILTPTRELAAQVQENIDQYARHTPLRSAVVYGGVKINPQMMNLRRGVELLVACPGRLLDLYQQNAIRFDQLEVLVLDEADRMLDMGFIRDIKKILALLPAKRQNLLFSATFSDEIRDLAKGLVHNPVEISVTPKNATARTVEQLVHPVDKKQKAMLLTQLIGQNNWQQVLVFTKTKHMANRLARHLEEFNIKAAPIHGNKSQGARTRALAEFKSGDIRALVATDIAARGLDIDQLPQVVNFELPQVAEDYVHRIGRTGRAGASGHAISLVCAEEFELLNDIEQLTQQHLPREVVDGFNPHHPLPESKPLRPLKAKKPKKPKKPKAPQAGGGQPQGNAATNGEGQARNHNGNRRRRPNGGQGQRQGGQGRDGQRPTGGQRTNQGNGGQGDKPAGNRNGQRRRGGQNRSGNAAGGQGGNRQPNRSNNG